MGKTSWTDGMQNYRSVQALNLDTLCFIDLVRTGGREPIISLPSLRISGLRMLDTICPRSGYPFHICNLLHKMGNHFLDRQYIARGVRKIYGQRANRS